VARRGEVLESPINGQRAVFRETAQDTGGKLLRLDFFVAPGGFLGSEHLHPKQEERIEVLSGALRCRLSGSEQTLGRGDAVAVPRAHLIPSGTRAQRRRTPWSNTARRCGRSSYLRPYSAWAATGRPTKRDRQGYCRAR
jgi:Cupin domain